MKGKLTVEQMYLIHILKDAFNIDSDNRQEQPMGLLSEQWNTIILLAKRHAVLSLLYDVLKQKKDLPRDLFEEVHRFSKRIVLQSYRLLYLTNYIVAMLEQEAISVLLLKGVGTAALYPIPELRKSGDIDLLVAKKGECVRACEILEKNNFIKREKQYSNHHIIFETKDGIIVEIHTLLTEPFDNPRVNDHLSKLSIEYHNHSQRMNIMGSELPVPEEAYHAFYLLLHMLQHFLGSGFGLKLLCDWIVFWNSNIEDKEKERYVQLIKESGLVGFSEVITAVCVRYLGLKESRVPFLMPEVVKQGVLEEFLSEILEAEDFGRSEKERMVVLRGTTPFDYMRELHHQIYLNHPKARKNALSWPVFWVKTLLVFFRNNRKIRKISTMALIRKANVRSKSIRGMDLFLFQKK